MRLDLPPGPLATAVMTLASMAHANIGSQDPGILAIPIPAEHMSGSLASMLDRLARQSHTRLVRLPSAWQFVRADAPRHVAAPKPAPVPDAPIIVRASKRNALLRDEPVEVVHLTGLERDDFGAAPDTGTLLGQVPTLVSTHWGNGQDKLFLRGVADSSFAGPSPALVGQYVGDQRLTFSAPDPDLRLYDVASVEILEGPQGTLYGDGALGGLVRIEPNPPELDRWRGSAWAGVAATSHGGAGGDGGAVVNLPVVRDKLGLRLLGYDSLDAGYINDSERGLRDVNAVHTWGGRADLRARVADGWTVDAGGIVQHIDNRDAPYADAGAPLLTRSSDVAQPSYNHILTASVVIDGDVAGLKLRSTSGFVRNDFGQKFEELTIATNYHFEAVNQSYLISHETSLSKSSNWGGWVIGLSYISGINDNNIGLGILESPAQIEFIRNKSTDITVYGEIERKIFGKLSGTVGARYSIFSLSGEAIDLQAPFHILVAQPRYATSTERALLPSAALSYAFGGGATLFARYGQGFRPGGLTAGQDLQHFEADSIHTFEFGMRRGVAKVDTFAVSATASTSRWRNVQADLLNGQGLPYIANIGNGQLINLNATFTLRVRQGWSLGASGFVAHSHLSPTPNLAVQGDASALPNVVHDGETLSLDHWGRFAADRDWRLGLRVQHVGHSIFGVGPALAVPQGDYTTLAAGGSVRFAPCDVLVDASNLLDNHHNAFAAGTPLAGLVRQQITPLRPRTIRFGVQRAF